MANFVVLPVQPLVAGDSELLSQFAQGNTILLRSQASGKTLRFREGVVEGRGGRGALGKLLCSDL